MNKQKASQVTCGSGRILVAEDELFNRELLCQVLHSQGFQVTAVKDGDDAMNVFHKAAPDVVLSDIKMPGMDGFSLCRNIKGNPQTAHIPVLLVTALSERDDRIEGMESGADDFLTRPFDVDELTLRIRNAMFAKQLFDQLHQSYRQLRQLEELRDNLTNMIVHDMRGLLTAIAGGAELIKYRAAYKLDADEMHIIGTIEKNIKLLTDLITTILDISRLESGTMTLDIQDCDLHAIVSGVLDLHASQVQSGRIYYKPLQNAVLASCDPLMIVRVVNNLVSNALRAIGKEGQVEIKVFNKGDSVGISVSDNGPGIPIEYQSKIFDKFFQVKTGVKSEHSSGLGLYFCKMAVEALGGKISVNSTLKKGTVFQVELKGVHGASRSFQAQTLFDEPL
jgi:signal transduction histidine kinase